MQSRVRWGSDRLLKNVHLPAKGGGIFERRCPSPASLRRTDMYASLHLAIFEQPVCVTYSPRLYVISERRVFFDSHR